MAAWGSTARFRALGLVAAAVVGTVSVVSAGAAPNAGRQQAGPDTVRQVQVLEHDRTGVDAPTGLAFSPSSRSFYVIGARSGAAPAETDVVRLAPFELSPESDRAGSARIAAAVKDPANVAFDARHGRLLLLDNADRLLEVRPDANGDLDPRTLVRRDALRLDLRDAQGLTVDPASGTVFVLDAGGPRILRIEPAVDGNLDAAVVTDVDLSASGLSGGRGLAFDPSTGHLHLGSSQGLVELTASGEKVATRDLSGIALARPSGMAFAPSGDSTDDPAELSVYVADSGSAQGTGQIVEVSLASFAAPAAPDFTSSLENTVNMGGLSPPSPDPSGITYLPDPIDRLMISDGEVEETVNGVTHFQGSNVWELSRTGGVLRTTNLSNLPPAVVPISNEPTGVAFNPNTGHYYFSDDGQKKIYDLNPGADGLVGTSGDSWTSFDTTAAGNGDPEGVAFDTFGGHLFVADGVNKEVYEYTTLGTLVNHFDVEQYGVSDPETVEFNRVTGTLFVLSDRNNSGPDAPIIVETTRSGALLQTISVSASNGFKPAGLAYAPASNGSGAQRFYIVDRGVDNNNDPNESDGKLYELTAPQPSQPTNTPPVVGAGPDQSATLPASATLDGTVSDDGKPIPPGALTTAWSQIGGPGVITFGDDASVDTTASASIAGVYTVRLTANDGQFSAFDDAVLTFSGSGSVQSLDVRVTVGADDAEESTSNVVLVGNGDLDMMTADEANLVVGTRFRAVTIPQGATITNAYLQFTADEAHSISTTLAINGQAADNPPVFANVNADISSRPTTTASVGWPVSPWLGVGDALLAQRSPNLAPIVQEIVGRSGWTSGNSLVLLVTGSGTRVAESYNGANAAAPLLHVEWTTGSGNVSPVITSNGGGPIASVSAAENQTFVTDVDATDPNPDTLTYSISGGVDASRFAINGSTGVLTFITPPNFEAPSDAGANNVYDVSVSVSDGNSGSDSQAIAATVLDVNEVPPVISSNGAGSTANISVPENTTAVTTVAATDGDFDTIVYSLSAGADIDDFTIDPGTGALTFVTPPDFEAPADAAPPFNSYEVTVSASDGSLSDTQAVTVDVTDVAGETNQAPVVDAGPDQSVTLPASATLDGTVSDDALPNPPATVTTTWSQTSGPGTVTFGDVNAVDTTASFSAAGTYVLRLTASDSDLSAFD
ncbi:MAG TPA: cadherin domain-containing protein, partial [Gaiellaceae bacterium]|nr:cadherin domain-containing protein [Gaiellaceae bacterium]